MEYHIMGKQLLSIANQNLKYNANNRQDKFNEVRHCYSTLIAEQLGFSHYSESGHLANTTIQIRTLLAYYNN
jgi:hypothetical protein